MDPINLAVRFGLEVVALISFGLWGWRSQDGWLQYVLVIAVPLVFAAIWGMFNVLDDPSRSGNAPIVVPGYLRLLIELTFFGLAGVALYSLGYTRIALMFIAVVVVHYLISYERVFWLLKQ